MDAAARPGRELAKSGDWFEHAVSAATGGYKWREQGAPNRFACPWNPLYLLLCLTNNGDRRIDYWLSGNEEC